MIRFYSLAAAAGLAATTGFNAMAADGLPTETHKVLTVELAVEAAQAAIAWARAGDVLALPVHSSQARATVVAMLENR